MITFKRIQCQRHFVDYNAFQWPLQITPSGTEQQISHDDDDDDDDDAGADYDDDDDDDDDYDGDDDDGDDDEDDDDGRAQHLEASAWSIVKLTQFNAIPWLLEVFFSYQFSLVSVTIE